MDGNACGLYIIQKGVKRVFVRVPEDMIRMLQAYTRKPAEPIFQQPRKKTAFEKHPSVSRPPSESSIWLRKTATVCTPSPSHHETYLRLLVGAVRQSHAHGTAKAHAPQEYHHDHAVCSSVPRTGKRKALDYRGYIGMRSPSSD